MPNAVIAPADRPGELPRELPPKQTAFLAALLVSRTVEQAAGQTGTGLRSAYRYLADPLFQATYAAARREAVAHAMAKLQAASGGAVDVLVAVMDDAEAPASARVSAAKTVLDSAQKSVEMEELVGRVKDLEQALQEILARRQTLNGRKAA